MNKKIFYYGLYLICFLVGMLEAGCAVGRYNQLNFQWAIIDSVVSLLLFSWSWKYFSIAFSIKEE